MAVVPSSPRTLYAATVGAVFKTDNGGSSWTRLDLGVGDRNVTALAVDPTAPGTVYAGTWDGAIFKTLDAGASWRQRFALPAGAEPNTPGVYAIAVDPSTGRTVYAGSPHHTYRSDDAGLTWTEILTGGYNGASSIAVDARVASTVYVSSEFLHVSKDKGVTWKVLPGDGSGLLTADPRTGAVLASG